MGEKLYGIANLFLLLKINSSQMINLKTKKKMSGNFRESLRKQPNSLLPRRKAAGKSLMVRERIEREEAVWGERVGCTPKMILKHLWKT